MRVEVTLLGRFGVRVDGERVPDDRWNRRHAAALVKLLALAPRGRLHRDRAIDALWPDLDVEGALPRLYKAAHYARQALCDRDGIVIRDEVVALFPAATLDVDTAAFESAADADIALSLYQGELLPDDLHEPWSQEPRRRLQARYEQLLRSARRWSDLLAVDNADGQAHLELLREAVLAGDGPAAQRRLGEMQRCGVAVGPEAVALRDRVLSKTDPVSALPVRAAANRWATTELLLERENELAALARVVRSALRTGRGAVVLVAGEAGSGKSALIRAFLSGLDDDLAVAVSGCDDLLAPRSLGPFRDMAEMLPELASVLSRGAQPEDVFPGLLRLLAPAPTIMVLEDVHWADDATLDAIRYLSRRIGAVPTVLVLTYREEDVDASHPLRRILGSLSGSSTRRLALPALSVDAVRRLAGGDEAEAAEIHRITKGNPFFVTEVLDAGEDGVPATVRDAVLARVGRLPVPARRLAERVAVVPTRAERWLAEALAGDDPDALVQLERSGVVGGGADHVSFRHELVRQAIEAGLTPGELVRANREVLGVLLDRSTIEPARIVHHAAAALRTDLLLEYGPIAASEAERDGAHRQAAETLRVVLAHSDELDAATRATLLTRRAYSLYVVNEYDEAMPCADAAVLAAESAEDPVVLAEALMVLSRIVFFARGPMTARGAAGRAVEILDHVDDRARSTAALIELARTHSNLATLGVLAQPDAAAIEYADRALALSEQLHRDDLRAQALWYRGGARLSVGDDEGADDIERAIALTAAESRLETRVRVYVNAAGCAYRSGRPHDAHRYVATGLQLAADGEFAAGEYRLRLTSAAVSASQGDWDHAIGLLRRLVSGPGQPGMMGVLTRCLLARLLARRGDPEARDLLDEAVGDLIGPLDTFVAGPLAVAHVELAWLTGTAAALPAMVGQTLSAATAQGHSAIEAELCGYLRRAGLPTHSPTQAPGPWGPALAGRRSEAAQAWHALGDRYEEGVELALSIEDTETRTAGLAILRDLGATATLATCPASP